VTHERSLLSGVLARINAVARAEGAERITRVALRLGALAQCSPDHLREHFVAAARGTVAEGAEVTITFIPDPMDPHAHEVVLDSVEVEVEER